MQVLDGFEQFDRWCFLNQVSARSDSQGLEYFVMIFTVIIVCVFVGKAQLSDASMPDMPGSPMSTRARRACVPPEKRRFGVDGRAHEAGEPLTSNARLHGFVVVPTMATLIDYRF
jgi:hypothetical protein